MTPNPQAADTGASAEIEYQIDELMIFASAWKHTTPCTGASVDAQDALRNAFRTALLAGAAGGEPVAWIDPIYKHGKHYEKGTSPVTTYEVADWTPLYTAPPPPVGAPQGVTNEDLRQRLGEALTEVLTDENAAPEPDWFDSREIDRVIDAILPALATPSPAQAEPIELNQITAVHSGFTHESAVGPHPWVRVMFAVDDFASRDAFAKNLSAKLWGIPATGAAEGAEPTADAVRPNNAVLVPCDKLADLQKEAERLDWLESLVKLNSTGLSNASPALFTILPAWDQRGERHGSLRSSIDAARAAQKGGA